MRLLLDTHALLWYDTDRTQLSSEGLLLVRDRRNEVYVSSLSVWELAIKWKMGRLPAAQSFLEDVQGTLLGYGFLELGFCSVHALRAAQFDSFHKDPFDRGLAAQAQIEQLTILSKDTLLDNFAINRVW